jgi:CRISPR system Cascade subunit CasA
MENSQARAGPDLLTDPLFTIIGGTDSERLTLPGLLSRLLVGPEVHSFPEVAAEQRGAVWRFLVRCAARSLYELRITTDHLDLRPASALEEEIGTVLRSLAAEGAWCLHQPEPARPGFLQIATPDGAEPGRGNNYSARSVSGLTSLLGGKNHERKSDTARELDPEQTTYALIEYQLSAVFGGRGNYETQLLGSRAGAGSGVPLMGGRIGISEVETFRHDVRVMLDKWPTTARHLQGPVWALWAEPWDGKSQMGSERLDPAFIPIARMVRLKPPLDGRFRELWFRPTDTGRVRDHTGGGVLGDPLTPFVPDPATGSPKVRGTLRKGYDYTEVVRLLFGTADQGGTPSASVKMLAAEGDVERTDLRAVFEGTAYEQGKTGGFHRREVMLPPQRMELLVDPQPVHRAHRHLLDAVKETKAALRGAARILLNGELRPREGDAAKTEVFAAQLEPRVDAVYLSYLWDAAAALKAGEEESTSAWTRWLSEQAERIFRSSLGLLPASTGRRFERETRSEAYLRWKLAQMRGDVADAAPDAAVVETDTPQEEEQPI